MRVRVHGLPSSVSVAAVLALHAPAPAPAAEADVADPTTVDRVLVTGEKRARTLQDTTSSVLDWSAWLFANNLLDRQSTQYRWSDQPVALLGAPRVVGIGFEARW